MKKIYEKHKSLWSQKSFFVSVLLGIALLASGLFLNYVANNYAIEASSNAVSDILLDNLPVVNTEIIFVEGSLAFIAFVLAVILHEPRRIPFVLESTAVFVIIRSVFVTLTHLGPFPQRIVIHSTSEIFKIFVYSNGADLFFSGHTGLPFLFALMFWRKYILRMAFLLSSVVAAASVILGHVHYSIDVLAAFFITYAIYRMNKFIFKKDYQVFVHGLAAGGD